MLSDVRARLDGVLLELTVDGGVHLVDEHAVGITREEVVPLAAPDDLDDVPTGAAEDCLQLLNDLAVAAHGTVEALEVAVHDGDEVVEILAGGDRQAIGALGLVHLAVADEAPHLRLARVGELVIDQVPVETRLGDRVDRAQPH